MVRVSAAQLLAKIETRNPNKRLTDVIWGIAAYHKGPTFTNSSRGRTVASI